MTSQVTASIEGCPGLTSSESVLVLVDENVPEPRCNFDQGPDVNPALDVNRSIQFCEDKIFATIDEGEMCVRDNSKAEDVAGDCRPIETEVNSTEVGTCTFGVTVSPEATLLERMLLQLTSCHT